MVDNSAERETSPSPRWRQLTPFLCWLAMFYTVWLAIVCVGDYWSTLESHWGIAIAMTFGSYVAGSTPMGGGTVGFPVLVLIFDQPGSLGRNFGLAIQSIGMTSASIYLFSLRRPLDWGLLRPTLLGSLIGTPIGAAFIAPFIPDLWVKLTFAILWASFGVMHLVKLRELIGHTGENTRFRSRDFGIGLAVGLVGGVTSSITGVGIDMILYAVMVLLFQADLKISIPSSVVAMAFTSLIGISMNLLLSQYDSDRYFVSPEVFYHWLAAAPVVALGAPLGAWVVNLIPRAPTLIFVSLLCIGQFVWTITQERVQGWSLIGSLSGILVMNVLFHVLYRWGRGTHVLDDEPLANNENC
ncbi:MAG: sulfite exporter TauE/SafE family protein [Planctomycetaceae bacterium]